MCDFLAVEVVETQEDLPTRLLGDFCGLAIALLCNAQPVFRLIQVAPSLKYGLEDGIERGAQRLDDLAEVTSVWPIDNE